MNKKLLKLSAVAVFAMGAAPMAFAQSSQGQVTFNGELTASTCLIASGDEDKTVTLPTISTSAFSAMGDVAGSKMFTIGVTGCASDISRVAAHWETSNMNPATGNARNLSTGDASATPPKAAAANVDVQLLDADGTTAVRLGSTGAMVPVTGTGAARGVVLNYGGQYYANSNTMPTAGLVRAVARFTLAYN